MAVEERFLEVAPAVRLRLLCRNMSGPSTPFLLVHGLASNARLWDGVADVLAAAGHPVVAVDLRGHGQSTKPDDGYDFSSIVADLTSVIAQLGWQRPAVAGQSWGGNVVIELAATAPDVLSAVIAVDGGFIELSDRFATWEACAEALAPPRLVGTPVAQIEQWLRREHSDWPGSGIEGTMANYEVRTDGTIAPWLSFDNHMKILRALYGHKPSHRYSQISVPALMVVADSGPAEWSVDKRSAVDSALALLSNGQAVWFPEADHDVHAQHPHEVARAMIEFVAEVVPS